MSVVEKILNAAGISLGEYSKYGIGKGARIVRMDSDTMADPSRRHVRRPLGKGSFKYNKLTANEDCGAESGAGDHHTYDES